MRLISFDSFEEEEVFLIENIRERENEWRWRRKKTHSSCNRYSITTSEGGREDWEPAELIMF